MLGVGVMIQQLSGAHNHSVECFLKAKGKTFKTLLLHENTLILGFEDGSELRIWDNGQSCCENRYMHTDDDLSAYVGAKLVGAELREAPEIVGEYGDPHEVQFLAILTDRGQFVVSNHNEHNGYYGGFSVEATYTPAT